MNKKIELDDEIFYNSHKTICKSLSTDSSPVTIISAADVKLYKKEYVRSIEYYLKAIDELIENRGK
ncbi:MAG: hypothetical protein KAG14_04955 [Mycoplasmataceae bacterium]|nr:hypothetical protein [Mycoplasmataceae bacterium]